jgi:hypothetical protein
MIHSINSGFETKPNWLNHLITRQAVVLWPLPPAIDLHFPDAKHYPAILYEPWDQHLVRFSQQFTSLLSKLTESTFWLCFQISNGFFGRKATRNRCQRRITSDPVAGTMVSLNQTESESATVFGVWSDPRFPMNQPFCKKSTFLSYLCFRIQSFVFWFIPVDRIPAWLNPEAGISFEWWMILIPEHSRLLERFWPKSIFSLWHLNFCRSVRDSAFIPTFSERYWFNSPISIYLW